MSTDEIYALVIQNFPDGIIIADHNDEIVFVNSAAEKIRHISKAEKIGKDILCCHSATSQEKVKRALAYLKTKQGTFKRMVTDSSNNKIYENVYQTIIDETGDYRGTLILSKDITEKQKIEQENLNYNQKLKFEIAGLNERLNSLFINSLTSLVYTLEAKDIYTKGHSERVTKIASSFVHQVYGQTQLLADVELAAKLHDIGKIGISEAILNKPGKLTAEEIALMRTHPNITAQILSPFDNLKEVIDIAKHHHERYDGKGYPDGLKGEEIPLGSRILALADTYDAMTSTRPYREAQKISDVLTTIRENIGTQFDPKLGMKFIELIESGTI